MTQIGGYSINIVGVLAYLVLAPLIGGLLAGFDRKISARMQGRVGPPVLQPFFDVFKLLEKEKVTVNTSQGFYIACCLIFMIITGCLFFAGTSLLLVIFALTVASLFLVAAAFSSNSPYAQAGAERELLQMMAYEPMVLIAAVGLYLISSNSMGAQSFNISDIMASPNLGVMYLPGIFLGFLFILTIKLRKSPFDLSTSHHAHQELVKGLTTELSGSTLAMLEVAHWYENVMLLGFIYLFFANGTVEWTVVGIVVCVAAYFLEVFIDNVNARMKWQFALNSSWIVALALGSVNMLIVYVAVFFGNGIGGGV